MLDASMHLLAVMRRHVMSRAMIAACLLRGLEKPGLLRAGASRALPITRNHLSIEKRSGTFMRVNNAALSL